MELIGKGRQAEVFAVNSEECVKLFYKCTGRRTCSKPFDY